MTSTNRRFVRKTQKKNRQNALLFRFLSHTWRQKEHMQNQTQREREWDSVCAVYTAKKPFKKRRLFSSFFPPLQHTQRARFPKEISNLFFLKIGKCVCVVDTVVSGVGAHRLCRVAAMSEHLINCNND